MSEKMREILFRGKSKAHNKWVYGWYCGKILNIDMCSTEESSQIIDAKTLYWHTCEPNTVGQFTGLYDSTKWEALTDAEKMAFYKKHYISEDGMSVRFQNVDDVKHLWKGKKIFEGDICRVSRPCVLTYGHIVFMNGCFWFADYGPGGLLRLCDVRMNEFTIEIVGNIHDNPELLKEETDG